MVLLRRATEIAETRTKPLVTRLVPILLLVSTIALAAGQAAWEMRVCADPANAPASTSDGGGYENRVAEIIADELGAELTYDWTLINDATVRDHLKRGACDVIMSVGEGAAGLLNTVSYYRVPMVFLHLAESGLVIESLYDPGLAKLRIGAVPNTATHLALVELGLEQSFVGIQPDTSKRGADRIRPLVEALREGTIDVAIVAGAPASVYVNAEPSLFAMTPVQPELFPPLTPMFHLATIGVRPRDEALRDALNRAVAMRWDEIQDVFAELGVPLLPSAPVAAGERPAGLLTIGVVAPFPSGFPTELDDVAESAFFGTRLADDLVSRGEGRQDLRLHLAYASAPSTEAALRAFDRLVAVDVVEAVVVLHDEETTEALARRAAEKGVLLVNALSGADVLRSSACYPTTFHVAPSDSMYVAAMVEQLGSGGAGTAAVVHDATEWSTAVARSASEALQARGIEVVDVPVSNGPVFPYADVRAVTELDVDAALVFLSPTSQSLLLFELGREGYTRPVLGFPWPVMQTRDYYYRLGQDSPALMATPRVTGWDATLADDGADELNLRFSSRSARTMDLAGWAAYAAVELVATASVSPEDGSVSVLEAIDEATERARLAKGESVRFDTATNQLMQPLYLARIDPNVGWSAAVSQRVAMAEVVGEVPSDALAVSPPETACE
ncbi:MAG TPA: ABC transporter substrate-binding protein [Trueperaceae bacterium]